MNTRLFTTLKNVEMLSFIDLCIPHFAVESALKFSLRVLWKMVLFMRDFQNMASTTEHCEM